MKTSAIYVFLAVCLVGVVLSKTIRDNEVDVELVDTAVRNHHEMRVRRDDSPEDSTSAPDDSTSAPDDSTSAPDDSTSAPDDSTSAPDDSTSAPDDDDSTSGPDSTSAP